MRPIQRGVSTMFVAIAILAASVAITFGYFNFFEEQKKVKAINSFEDCAKYYPVMESYPEQCNTPDGKHFTRQLTEEQKQDRFVPPPDEIVSWKTYTNSEYKFSINYPSNWQVVTKSEDPSSGARPVNFYPPEVDLNTNDPGVPVIGVRTSLNSNFPPEDFSKDGIDFITGTKEVNINGRAGYEHTEHQCAPQCVTETEFVLNNDQLIGVFITTVAKEQGYRPIYDEMVKSFKME